MNRKIKSPQTLKKILVSLQRKKKKVVFTNGCFDILHAGHVRYLSAAKKMGDVLLVALNSDQSIRRIKGERRPIVPQKERAEIIASLSCVDYVTFFDQDDPYHLIALLKPDVLTKGADWKKKEIIGAGIVEKKGGKVKTIAYHEGKSTTGLIQKIIETYGRP